MRSNPLTLRHLLVCAAVTAVAGALAIPAFGIEGEGFKLSDSSPKTHKEYAPIAGSDPSAQALTPTLANCRDLPGNVLVPIEMSFKRDFGHVAEFVVKWQAPEVDDVDIYFMDEGGEIIADSASSDMPETVRLGSLANGAYYLCVRNFSGPNTGFTLDASVRFLTLFERTPEPPTDSPPTPRTSASTTPQPGAGHLKVTPGPTAEAVDTPGPDGPFSEKGLINVAGNKQAAAEEGGRSLTQIVFIALTGVIAAGGVALVAVRIRRDTRT